MPLSAKRYRLSIDINERHSSFLTHFREMAEPENEDTVVPFIDMPPERDGGMGIVEHGDGIGGVDHGVCLVMMQL